ncbi:hypothetical protein ATE92_1744 [Ulvibacter sp. MAR_2010_11]|uniref:hypothetical protein n=1 Tax=Ulvibacter sp. MAR_2010_11 TaxID=1250229 RepID=UPI000C2BCFEA|nr:hypothetical protein [Ulvibacter sp. MAR_2010_11]PKA83587.1 hypothetical protein ATE92_1744 [Ulvibacter sp. MAR_2010_11]
MQQLIFYALRIVLLATALSVLAVHYLLDPLSKPVVLVFYGIIGLSLLSGLLPEKRELKV